MSIFEQTLESIVIVENARGFVASLRFSDPRHDCDLGRNNRFSLFDAIDTYLRTGYRLGG